MEYLLKKYNHPLKSLFIEFFLKLKKIRPEESFKMCSCKMDLSKVKIYLCLKILNKKNKVLSVSILAGNDCPLYYIFQI